MMTLPKFLGDFCPKCKRFRRDDRHVCPPTWKVRHDYDLANDWSVVFGCGEDDAACEFIASHDAEAMNFTSHAIVFVMPNDGEKHEPVEFEVEGEMVPQYTAHQR